MVGIQDLEDRYREHIHALASGDGGDMSDGVLPLFNYALDLKARRMVEFGVRGGVSTRALLIACTLIEKAHLWSVDVVQCEWAVNKIKELELDKYWTFHVMNDIHFVGEWMDRPIDLLFIDTSHTLEHTRNELKIYSPLVRKKGLIILHDTLAPTYPGVKQAIDEFLSTEGKKWQYTETPSVTYGLGVLKRV